MMLGTISGVLFVLGMCMALLPEWNAFKQGIILHSYWFMAVGVYYIILGMMRFWLGKIKKEEEWFVKKICGFLICMLALVMCIIVYMTIKDDETLEETKKRLKTSVKK